MRLATGRLWLALFVLMLVLVAGVTLGADIGLVPTNFLEIAYSDKVGHFVLYGMPGALLHLALQRCFVRVGWFAVPVAFLAVAALGIADEAQQMFMPHRAFDLVDLAADIAGVGLSILSLEIGYFRLLTGVQTGLK